MLIITHQCIHGAQVLQQPLPRQQPQGHDGEPDLGQKCIIFQLFQMSSL